MSPLFKVILPALATASTAYAACSVTATTTIQNAGDATALATCSTFSGSIAIATDTAEDIALNGIERLNGNLVAQDNNAMTRLSADSLETLDGEMHLSGLTRLFNLGFPQLKTVNKITWNALPLLQDLGFTSQVESAQEIRIENTALRSLEGLNIEEIDSLFIANNAYINEISMQLGNVSDSLTFADNNEKVVVTLPNLIWATNLTFRFCGSVELPSLETLNGSLGFYNNGFESFSAPNLTSIGEALAVVANEKLSNLTFPALTKVNGNLQLANNTALDDVSGFPQLESILGAFDLSGNMSNVETPKLDDVRGTFNLQSTGNVTEDCAFYKNLKDDKKIQGPFFCKGRVIDPGQEGHKPEEQEDSGEEKEGAASSLSAQNGALGLAALAAVLLL